MTVFTGDYSTTNAVTLTLPRMQRKVTRMVVK